MQEVVRNSKVQAQRQAVAEIRAALEHEPRVNLHRFPFIIGQEPDGVLVLEGETQNVAAKKLAVEVAAATPGVTGVVDRLRVVPAQPMCDGEVRNLTCDHLLEEPAFQNCAIRTGSRDGMGTLREPLSGAGPDVIEVSVADGVVTLEGRLDSLSHKSLAGALAWRVPGSRDVINAIEVAPVQEISDREITEAVRLALEKDASVDARLVEVITRNRVAVLDGYVVSPAQRERAEMDAWCVFGVDLVINRLLVQPAAGSSVSQPAFLPVC